MTSDELAFLRALIASPDDNDLRRVYADWLEERGDPRARSCAGGRRARERARPPGP